jgi:hypothetical protein
MKKIYKKERFRRRKKRTKRRVKTDKAGVNIHNTKIETLTNIYW